MTPSVNLLLLPILLVGALDLYGEEGRSEEKPTTPQGPTVQHLRIVGTEADELEKVLSIRCGMVFAPHMLVKDVAAIEKLSRYTSARAEIAHNDDGSINVTFFVARRSAGPPE